MNNEQQTTNNELLISIAYPTLVHFRHFSSLLTHKYQESSYLCAYKAPSLQLSRELYKSPLFMQNKPKVRKSQMNVNDDIKKDYENETLGERGKNKPKQTQPVVSLSNLFQSQKNAQVRISHYFKQFEKKLVTARLSRDYLENREKDELNRNFIFILGEIWHE